MDPKDNHKEEIIKRLNILIALALEQTSGQSTPPMSDRISKLARLGVPSPDIGRILGKPLNYVTATLSQQRSKKKVHANG